MCRKLALSLGAATLLVSLGAGELSAQFNPNGWIQTDGWNYLMPLTQNGGCGGGGEARMQGNWITPHVIGVENPKAGTSYFNPQVGKSTTKIDFPNTAGTTGWGGAGLVADPTWVSNSFIETSFMSQVALSMPNGDVVDYDFIADYLNINLVPTQPVPPPPLPPPPPLTRDFVLGLATTYIENKSGAPMEVEVCTASDDSIQVWVNNVLTTNLSACRGTGGGCDDSRLAILPPGISKIATLVWEGDGGWGFRLGIRIGGVLITDGTAPAANLAFLGTGVGSTTTVGQLQYSALRSTYGVDPAFCVDTGTAFIRVQGSGPGAPGDLLTVVEEIIEAPGNDLGSDASPNIIVSNISNGGVLLETLSPDFPGTAVSSLPLRDVVGTTAVAPCGTLMNTTDNGGGSYTSVSDSGTDIWADGDSFEFGYEEVTGDFDISIEMTNYTHATNTGRWGKFGLMARQDLANNARFTMAQAHGPVNDDGARQAGRTVQGTANAVYETPFPTIPPRPRFLRLTRRGNVLTAWASQDARLADGTINPCNDGNWIMGRPDDWGAGAPATLNVGFANSEHVDINCGPQTVTFRLLPCSVGLSLPIAKETITWTGVARSTVTDTGLTFDSSTASTLTAVHSGKIIDTSVTGGVIRTTAIDVATSGPVGIFDDSRDIGAPGVPGETVLSGDTYAVSGSGVDIWDNGDDFHFAYQRVTGDFVMTAHVANRTTNVAGDRWGRHGLMARYTCHRNSKYSAVFTLFPTAAGEGEQDWARHQFRVNHLENGGTRDYYQTDPGTFSAEGQLPTWMRLVRNGNALYSYLAEDNGGAPGEWCLVGSDAALSRPDELLVGLAVQGRSNSALATAEFDNVTIEPLDIPSSSCSVTAEVASIDFTGADGSSPANSLLVLRAGAFTPGIVGNRLRLSQEGIGGSATAAWTADALPVQGGFHVEFDAYMSHSVLPGDANPADGMTFAVVQGTPEELFRPCSSTGTPMITALDESVLVGTDSTCGASSSTDNGGGSYTSVSATGKDVWAGGDDFMYTYTEVTGDFDIAIEVTSYSHATNTGRWGKFGLMARQTDGTPATERTSRYSFIQAHGPVNDDTVSFARRRDHNVPNFDQMDEIRDGLDGLNPRPRFLRLTRRGNIITGWASNDAGLVNGVLDPGSDCNWKRGFSDDWGAGAPATLLVGYANSEHGDVNCGPQTVTFRLLSTNPGAPAVRTDLAGDGGGALGYDGGTLRARIECNPSFAVEMDNWVGGGEPGTDPGDGGSPGNDGRYHFGLDLSANVASIQTNVSLGVGTASLPGIFSPMGIHVEVDYAPNGQIDVHATANDGSVGRTLVLSDLIQPLTGPALLGFTAGTGGATATQEIDNLSISTVCCEGSADSVVISGADTGTVGTPVVLTATPGGLDGAATYAWSIVSGPGTVTNNGDGTANVDGTAAGAVVVSVTVNDGVCGGGSDEHTVTFGVGGTQKPNDMNGDGNLDISDPVATLNHLFLGGVGPICGDGTIIHAANLALLDANASGAIDISDPVFVLNFLFLGGPTPGNCNGDVTCPCITIPDCPNNEACD